MGLLGESGDGFTVGDCAPVVLDRGVVGGHLLED